MKWILIFIAAVFGSLCSVQAAERNGYAPVVREFLQSRTVLCSVYFSMNSSELNREGEQILEKLLPRLKDIDSREFVLRIEGNSPGTKHEKTFFLAMLRAKAVADYLSDRLPQTVQLTLTGRVPEGLIGAGGKSHHRADIVVYDNLVNINTAKIDQIITR